MSKVLILTSQRADTERVLRKALHGFIMSEVIGADPTLLLDTVELKSRVTFKENVLVAQIVAGLLGDEEGMREVLKETMKTELDAHQKRSVENLRKTAHQMIDEALDHKPTPLSEHFEKMVSELDKATAEHSAATTRAKPSPNDVAATRRTIEEMLANIAPGLSPRAG